MDTLYTDILLDLYKHPLNKTPLTDFDVRVKETNPLCGDEVEVFIKFDENDRVSAVGWLGDGCAISQASASLLTEYIKEKNSAQGGSASGGKTKIEIGKITKEAILKMLGLENLNPTRMRCALLTLEAIRNSLIPNS